MTLFRFFLISLVCVSGSFALAKAKVNSSELRTRAGAYLLNKASISTEMHTRHSNSTAIQGDVCKPSFSSECVEFVAGSYPSSEQRVEAARACAGNHNVTCAQFVAGSWPSFEQRVASARACRNNYDITCAEFVAGSWPSFEQKVAAAQACENADVECVKLTAGSWPSVEQKLAAAKACGGN